MKNVTCPRRIANHYCSRTDGTATKDHKLAKVDGGGDGQENIVLCCKMCNMIKSAREYGMFVALFREFLQVHGEEYRDADPDHLVSIRAMARKFDRWLNALQRGPIGS